MSETTYMSTIDRDLQERQAVALERLAAALEQLAGFNNGSEDKETV